MQRHLLKLAKLIEIIQHSVVKSPTFLKEMQSALKAEITKHKEDFSKRGYSNVMRVADIPLVDTETIQDAVLLQDAKRLFTSYLHTLTTLTDEYRLFVQDEFDDAVNKLYALCVDDHDPSQCINNVMNLLHQYAEDKSARSARPIFKLCEFFELPSNDFSKPIWYKLVSTHNKKALKLLAKADEIEKLLGQEFNSQTSYEKILETWLKLVYPKYSDAIAQASVAFPPTHLRDFTELCAYFGVYQTDYNDIINSLGNIKKEDKLPNIEIDGKHLGGDFAKYYMLKLPHNDLRGFILGELTGCCQNVYNEYSGEIVKSCMTDPNYGIYVILQKDKKGAVNIKNFSNKIVAQSIAWLGDKTSNGGKTLVFDSWERIGEYHDKLLYPFYSKFAEKAASEHNFKKVYIGMAINSPPTIYTPYDRADNDRCIQRNGEIPNNDSKAQRIILDEELDCNTYNKKTKEKYDSITKCFEQILQLVKKEGCDNNIVPWLLDELFNNIDKTILYDILRISAESNAKGLLRMILKRRDSDNQSIQLENDDILANAVEEDHQRLACCMINDVPLRSQVLALHVAVYNENEELASSMLSAIQQADESKIPTLLCFATGEWYCNVALFIMQSKFSNLITAKDKLSAWSYIQEGDEIALVESQQLEALAELLKSQMQNIPEAKKDELLLYAAESAILKEALNLLNMTPEDISNETALKIQAILDNAGSISWLLDDSDFLDTSVLEQTVDFDAANKEVREIIEQALKEHPNTQRIFGNKDYAAIPGIPEAFSFYYQNQVNILLKLRLEHTAPAALQSVNFLEENYTLKEGNEYDIAEKLSSFIIASNKNTILMPLNIGGNHLVGIAAVKDGNNVVIHYMDSELGLPPAFFIMKIGAILESHSYSIELRIAAVERQKYSNCGPEVIENFLYYCTGKRATQENAVPIYSLLLENAMLDQAIYANQREQNKDIIEYLSHQRVSDKIENIVENSNAAAVSLAILPQIAHTSFVAIGGGVEPNVFLTSNAIDKSASSVVYDVYWKPAANLFNTLDISWHIKKIIYHADVSRFNQMLKHYNIESSIDIFKDNSKFKKELLLKLHPDKGGSSEGFVFVSDLKKKFEADLNVQTGVQAFLSKTMTSFKILDTVVESARFMYEPTKPDNLKKVLVGAAQIYGLYYGVDYSTVISALDAVYHFYLAEYEEAAVHTMIAACSVALNIIGQPSIPHIGLVYSAAITVYAGYSTVLNACSLYLQVNSRGSSDKPIGADDKLSTQLPYIFDIDDFFIDADYDGSVASIDKFSDI